MPAAPAFYSSVPRVRAAFTDRLRTVFTAAGSPAVVYYGHPGQALLRDTLAVIVNGTNNGVTQTPERLGGYGSTRARDESYALQLVIWAGTGDDDVDAPKRAYEAAHQVLTLIAADLRVEPGRTLDNLLTPGLAQIEGWTDDEGTQLDQGGWLVTLTVRILITTHV